MGNKKTLTNLKSDSGQSTVEYILLLAVVVVLMSTVLNNQRFKSFFGDDSAFFTAIATRISMTFRYATNVSEADNISNTPVKNHPSFVSPDGSSTRFFGHNSTGDYPIN